MGTDGDGGNASKQQGANLQYLAGREQKLARTLKTALQHPPSTRPSSPPQTSAGKNTRLRRSSSCVQAMIKLQAFSLTIFSTGEACRARRQRAGEQLPAGRC